LSEAFGLIWWKMSQCCNPTAENERKKLDADRKHYSEELVRWEKEFSIEDKTDKDKEKYFREEINMNV